MSLSTYLWGIRLFVLLSLCAWLGVIFAIDPGQGDTTGITLFFISFFALSLGFLTLSVTWLYRKLLGVASAAHHLGSAFRQAFLLAVYVLGIVFFQFQRLLTWWDASLLLVAVFLIEYSLRHVSRQED